MFEDYPDLMSAKEAASALTISQTMMYRLLRADKIKHLHIGKSIKIPKRYLIDFVETECYNASTAAGNSVLSLKEV